MKIDITKNWTVASLLNHMGSADDACVLEFVKPAKAKTGTCWCGCGGTTKGGRFIPGHDSKFHSLAKQVARGLSELTQEDIEETLPCDGAIEDFRHHIAKELPLHTAREAAKAKLKADKAAAKAAKTTTSEILESDEETSETGAETDDAEVDELLAGFAN